MNIITQIKVLRENYSPLLAAKQSRREDENDWDFQRRLYSVEREATFKLPNNPLPRGHSFNLEKAENIFIRGKVGVGKTTFLLGIQDSIEKYKTFLSTGNSLTQSSNNFPLFTEWQKMNDKDLFAEFKDHPFIESVYDSMLKSIPFDDKREKDLLARITRNSNEHKIGSRPEKKENILNYAKKLSMNYSEFLEKYCLFVEAGLYITKFVSPETMFGNYELIFNDKVNPEKINAQYLNFYNLPGKGLSQGQKTMRALEKMHEDSTDLTLILLDEPTNSLPESEIEKVAKLISTAKGQKFIVTHNDKLGSSDYFPSGVGSSQIHRLNENQRV